LHTFLGNFDKEKLQILQMRLDEFCEMYSKFYGGKKITNYLHIMWGGHLSTFLRIYGNLYMLSNQGFEGIAFLIFES
jgi:hypothetical protein